MMLSSRSCLVQRIVPRLRGIHSVVVTNPSSTTCKVDHNYFSTTNGRSTARKTDPMARRPNKKCDPYGQGGQPMSLAEAQRLLVTVDSDWRLDELESPQTLTRIFEHPDYLSGARFVHKLAGVAQVNNHFPLSIHLERRIVRKNWQVVTVVQCGTFVIGGLTKHDFHLAMMMDVEASRPEVVSLLTSSLQA